jgi:CheY-like chemotaxis protein
MGKTIMIVEDEQAFHDLYTMMLEDTDYEIVRAYDGDEALAKLEEKKPLYIKGMPEYSDIPVIICSSFSQKAYKNLKDMDPNLVFLEKPFTKEKMIEEIKAKIG